jgi:twitching motility protein PilT
MGTILIDKLLSACVKQGASDLQASVGQAPVARIDGELRTLEPQILQPADVLAVVNSITPDRCHHELRLTGQTEFSFGFGDVARVRAFVGRQAGHVAVQLQLS